VVEVQRYAKLFQVVAALCPARGFSRSLYGRQQQRNKQSDDGDHHQEFY